MKEVPIFIKWMQDYFYQIKHKGKMGGRVYTKFYVIYNYPVNDIAKMLKEEFSELKLYMNVNTNIKCYTWGVNVLLI